MPFTLPTLSRNAGSEAGPGWARVGLVTGPASAESSPVDSSLASPCCGINYVETGPVHCSTKLSKYQMFTLLFIFLILLIRERSSGLDWNKFSFKTQ